MLSMFQSDTDIFRKQIELTIFYRPVLEWIWDHRTLAKKPKFDAIRDAFADALGYKGKDKEIALGGKEVALKYEKEAAEKVESESGMCYL